MSPEHSRTSEKNIILLNIKNLFIEGPDKFSNDHTVEEWGRLVEAEEKYALNIGIRKTEIEFAKLKGMNPKDRQYYISTLIDDTDISIERGELPEISKRELKNLERRVKRLNKKSG